MAEDQEQGATVPANTADQGRPAPAGRQGQGGKLGVGLALLALLLAAAALGLQQQQHQGVVHQLATLGTVSQSELSALKDSLRSEIQAGVQAARDADGRASAVESGLQRVQQDLAAMTTADRSDWLLAEVEYLLRLAVQRVQMEDDTAGAQRILQQADLLLADINEPRLFPVREALAQDIAAVRAAGVLDVEGIYLRLGAAAGRITELPLLVPSAEAREAYRAQSERVISEDISSVKEAALRVWDKLRGLIVIRYREDQVRPLLPPDQEYYLRHNLRMLLTQAQLALLRSSNAVYQQSLQSALAWLQAYFPAEAPEVVALQTGLQELQQFDVGPRRPEVGLALDKLRKQQAGRHLHTPAAGQAGG